ncbi:MAG: hypothetical protein ACT4OO_11335 [Nitrospiraceae bacterium]
MQSSWFRALLCYTARQTLAGGLVVLLLALAPLAVAQDVHHELAAADHDGHEHSDSDLCQWVQHHTTGSLAAALPPIACVGMVGPPNYHVFTEVRSADLHPVGPSRAPPRL